MQNSLTNPATDQNYAICGHGRRHHLGENRTVLLSFLHSRRLSSPAEGTL